VGILLAVFCCLAWGAADFLGGSASSGRPALLVVLLAQAFGLLTAGAAAIGLGITISASSAIGAGAAGICGAIAFIAFYRALTLAPMGVVAPLVGTSVVIPVTFGAVRGQWPPPIGMIGIAVAAVGALLALGVRSPSTHVRLSGEVKVLCLIAMIGFGAAITLFAGSVGGAFGDISTYADILASVRFKLFALDDTTVLMPGHGPPSTIAEEKAHNPFF